MKIRPRNTEQKTVQHLYIPIVTNNITFVSRVFIIESAAVLFDFTATLKNRKRAVFYLAACARGSEKSRNKQIRNRAAVNIPADGVSKDFDL